MKTSFERFIEATIQLLTALSFVLAFILVSLKIGVLVADAGTSRHYRATESWISEAVEVPTMSIPVGTSEVPEATISFEALSEIYKPRFTYGTAIHSYGTKIYPGDIQPGIGMGSVIYFRNSVPPAFLLDEVFTYSGRGYRYLDSGRVVSQDIADAVGESLILSGNSRIEMGGTTGGLTEPNSTGSSDER